MEALFQCLDELEDLALICWERARALCPAMEPRSGETTKPARPTLGSRAIAMAAASCPAETGGRSGT